MRSGIGAIRDLYIKIEVLHLPWSFGGWCVHKHIIRGVFRSSVAYVYSFFEYHKLKESYIDYISLTGMTRSGEAKGESAMSARFILPRPLTRAPLTVRNQSRKAGKGPAMLREQTRKLAAPSCAQRALGRSF